MEEFNEVPPTETAYPITLFDWMKTGVQLFVIIKPDKSLVEIGVRKTWEEAGSDDAIVLG